MGDYAAAGRDADSCLSARSELLDFNKLNAASPNPVARFNAETIFYALSSGGSALNPATARVDTALYAAYAPDDLRRVVFFKTNADGSHAFKGNYDGAQSAFIFSGPCTDELYLVSAECHAWLGEVPQAMDRLNALLVTRFAAGRFTPLIAGDADEALRLVLTERRKELVFRGLRWTDLKRLNREERFRVTLRRSAAVGAAELLPGDLRYALLIPQKVISATGMPQNAR